ncbi:MAG: helix-turn-helix transcriptional regulator [Anaerotignum sp.]
MAYKNLKEITNQIGLTVDIIEQIRSVYNFKAVDGMFTSSVSGNTECYICRKRFLTATVHLFVQPLLLCYTIENAEWEGGVIMAIQPQKMKTLYLMEILLQRTDEKHILSANDLAAALQEYGIKAERKSIYADIEALQQFGMDIVQQKGAHPGYYVASRNFELPELKLLVDAVQSSKFITTKKSDELIRKLEGMTSKYEAQQLQRDVFIYNRLKTINETIYYNVDQIHNALHSNAQISFQYAEWTTKKELQLKKNGALYFVSPWALTWDDENYYLIAYDAAADIIKHYRVDKMKHIHILDEVRVGKERFLDFDLAAFAKKTFGMYGGYDTNVTLLCHNSLVGVMLDRFGQDVPLVPVDEEHFYVKPLVAVSPQFFGWVTGIGSLIKIDGPENVKREYQEYLKKIIENYV